MHCPRCQRENRPQAKFCEECGTPLARSCGHCGAVLSTSAKFCNECGRTGDRAKATEHLTTASMMYREMDMRFWLGRPEAVVQAAG